MDSEQLMKTGETLLETTYDTTLGSMNTAFALATALAWNDAIKTLVQNFVPKGSGHNQMLMYALFITVAYAGFVMLTNRPKKNVSPMLAKLA